MSDFNGRYILDAEGNPQPCEDLLAWAMWFEGAKDQCRLARDQVGDYTVSTIFLALDYDLGRHDFDPLHYQPTLWETMVFNIVGGPCEMWRYRSREAALEGHRAAIQQFTLVAAQEEAWLKESMTGTAGDGQGVAGPGEKKSE